MILQGGEVNPESFCLLFLNNEKAEIKEIFREAQCYCPPTPLRQQTSCG